VLLAVASIAAMSAVAACGGGTSGGSGASVTAKATAASGGTGTAAPSAGASATARATAPTGGPTSALPTAGASAAAKATAAKGAGTLIIAGPDGLAEFSVASKSSSPLIKPPQDNTYLMDPAVSPDGALLAYVVQPPPKIQGKTYDAGSDLWAANRDGTNTHAVFTHDTPNQLVRFPQWEDAGHIIAIVQEITQTSGATNVAYTLERIDVATGRRTAMLKDVLAFGLSPDRKSAVYARLEAQTGETLNVLDLTAAPDAAASRTLIGLDQNLAPFNAPRYSPDGSRIAFASADQTGARAHMEFVTARGFGPPPAPSLDGLPEDVWVIDAAGGTPQQVADIKEDLPFISWNGDGTHIYVIGAAALYDVSVKSGAVTHIGAGTFHGQLVWTL
jgi:hypothetical protein